MKYFSNTILLILLSSAVQGQPIEELPFEFSKKTDARFYELTKQYELKYSSNKAYNGMSVVRLYVDKWNQASEDGLDNGTEFEHKGFLQIDGYYFEISLGAVDWETMNYDLEIKDIAGADNRPEILLNSGCFSDAGCLDKSYLIITHEQEPFTALDLEVPVNVDPYGEEGEVVITNEMYWIEDDDDTNNSECYILKESYRLTRYSLIRTNSYLERKKIECAE